MKKNIDIKNKLLTKLQKYLPRALFTLALAMPAKTIPNQISDTDKKIAKPEMNSTRKMISANAIYNESIAEISAKTETGDYKNQASVATGNGYYGKYQFGGTAASEFMVNKYVAYALAKGPDNLVSSLKKHLVIGSEQQKKRIIDDFRQSVEKYKQRNKEEQAFKLTNPKFVNLQKFMHITPDKFRAAHIKFDKEGSLMQEMFVYNVYLKFMAYNLPQIRKNHPNIDFEKIHPATWGAVIAIAIKQGSGLKFEIWMNEYEKNHTSPLKKEQQHILKIWEQQGSKKLPPLLINCGQQKISPENIVAKSVYINKKFRNGIRKRIKVPEVTIYDADNVIIEDKIKLADGNAKVKIIKSAKPAEQKSEYSIFFSNKNNNLDLSDLNSQKWLKDYCMPLFKHVYEVASANLPYIPSEKSNKEMQMFLGIPDNKAATFQKVWLKQLNDFNQKELNDKTLNILPMLKTREKIK